MPVEQDNEAVWTAFKTMLPENVRCYALRGQNRLPPGTRRYNIAEGVHAFEFIAARTFSDNVIRIHLSETAARISFYQRTGKLTPEGIPETMRINCTCALHAVAEARQLSRQLAEISEEQPSSTPPPTCSSQWKLYGKTFNEAMENIDHIVAQQCAKDSSRAVSYNEAMENVKRLTEERLLGPGPDNEAHEEAKEEELRYWRCRAEEAASTSSPQPAPSAQRALPPVTPAPTAMPPLTNAPCAKRLRALSDAPAAKRLCPLGMKRSLL
jgi:hypothetical protein